MDMDLNLRALGDGHRHPTFFERFTIYWPVTAPQQL